jgi:hypothetical protein
MIDKDFANDALLHAKHYDDAVNKAVVTLLSQAVEAGDDSVARRIAFLRDVADQCERHVVFMAKATPRYADICRELRARADHRSVIR